MLYERRSIKPITYDVVGECWICTSHAPNSKGYPQIMINGKTLKLSRYVYNKEKGEIPQGMLICHSCDNPACINPLHLWSGTHKDNMQDMQAKGRRKGGRIKGKEYDNSNKSRDKKGRYIALKP
jgi:hypothetical protein